MKKIDRFKHQLVGGALALAVILLAARAGAETIAQVVQVIQVKGNARYLTLDKHWHDLKAEDILQPGVVIQTAAHSFVDIQLSDKDTAASFQTVGLVISASASAYAPPASGGASGLEESRANVVRIFEIQHWQLISCWWNEPAWMKWRRRNWICRPDESWAMLKSCPQPRSMRSRFRMVSRAFVAAFTISALTLH